MTATATDACQAGSNGVAAKNGLGTAKSTGPGCGTYILDCYPYTFSPLLLFAEADYFDRGYSNYNAVARFFKPALKDVDMLENVLYDRKNMLYEELLAHVTSHRMLVTCCIDAHFTAFQVVSDDALVYYDPLQPTLSLVTGDNFRQLAGFLLLKCNYGDSQHMQDNRDHYMGSNGNALRRQLYNLWKNINTLEMSRLNIRSTSIPLDLDQYLLCNGRSNHQGMSCQLTGNTCYFQTYLFAVLCKAGGLAVDRRRSKALLQTSDRLASATVAICQFLLEFFVEAKTGIMRPLTNSNFALDFHRYLKAPYFSLMTQYLQHRKFHVPQYESQYQIVLEYFKNSRTLHTYGDFTLSGAMPSTLNTKSLQPVFGTDDSVYKLGQANYYKFRPCNLMFGFNTNIMLGLASFCQFNALRKNQLLAFYKELHPIIGNFRALATMNQYRDYYFIPQFEIGQQELIDVHHFTYLIDMCAMLGVGDARAAQAAVECANQLFLDHVHFSTQRRSDYEKLMPKNEFKSNKRLYPFFSKKFMSVEFFTELLGLGFAEINPREKEINSLTQTAFYSVELMRGQAFRMEHEFEKECINQMSRSTTRKYLGRFEGDQDLRQKYRVAVKIGHGFTYSKYNTLMHFLNVVQCYWQNPDLSNVQVFGKDIRTLLAVSCQKIFFEDGHTGFYHYGVMEDSASAYSVSMDLAMATNVGYVNPSVSRGKRSGTNYLVLTDRVFEFHHLRHILLRIFEGTQGARLKTDNVVVNLCLLSLMLDFGLYEQHASLLNLRFMQRLQRGCNDKRQLQVEVANMIHEFDRKNTADSVTRIKLEALIFEASYKFLVNKNFPTHSKQNELIQQLNSDPAYQQQLLLCKVYMSLCQINKSVEVDYYKVRCNGEFMTVIPHNFSKSTGEYLEEITKRYAFSERDGFIVYDELQLFDLRASQPEIDLFKVRLDPKTDVQSMVKYLEIQNAFQAIGAKDLHLIFIADNTLLAEVAADGSVSIRISKIQVEVATSYFNEAISFIPCFSYTDSEDVILFASRNIRYHVDQGGQFCTDYYGMKHELIECIESDEVFVDLNDEHVFKEFKLSELLTESKTVVYYPDYLLQVPSRQELINLLDLAIHVRNVSFFILVLLYLLRCSVALRFKHRDRETRVVKITGPWLEAIYYALGTHNSPNASYDTIFQKQFFDINQHQRMPLPEFIEVLCDNFTKYQRFTDDGQYQIVPTEKQKAFLHRIVTAEECFHFSEVGSGKTKVILPLLCQLFLSNNDHAHRHFARSGRPKNVLVVLVPEHLVVDARAQVFRYCLNLNFREGYRIYDDIFALLHDQVDLGQKMKQIFVTSFNMFKKALTYDKICRKVWPVRERVLVVADEVDDFLDRDKLVFNICSNKNNAFDAKTLELYFEVSFAAYHSTECPRGILESSGNPEYWSQLLQKFAAIHEEIQDASKSVNKSFGIFNEQTLRHCSSNIAHDIEGYKSLIARPYESVNRAMPGSYYSDVERTIYLTYVLLVEDIAKYDELFQQERKFISFEYWSARLNQLDFDDLVYGHDRLSELVAKVPSTKDGLVRFLYEIILRRMEIRDKSRSVNSVDVVFNFDCIGFTGTPFIDNYPTFAYLKSQREDEIPDMIDRRFYAYSCEDLAQGDFEAKFAQFQGHNRNVLVEYVSSDFMRDAAGDELGVLGSIFTREEQAAGRSGRTALPRGFNAIVDLCGIFKRSTIHDVRDLVLRRCGPDRFHYVYHIDQTDGGDRVLSVCSDSDVQFDEEFFKFLVGTYGASLRDKVFFFVDNRNVIGKDVPFQLVFQRRFGLPLFYRSAVLAHDVDDFSKIWQAMGRSRTMNDTLFSIYKSSIPDGAVAPGAQDIKTQALTRQLYVRNCDQKMAGNLSSIYQTLISLLNLSTQSFYFQDEIVNTFLDKMTGSITSKVSKHEDHLARLVLGARVPAQILEHILADKFRRSTVPSVAAEQLSPQVVEKVLRNVVQQKFEQRAPSGDLYDEFLRLLSGEQQSLMEISYTKQQQKQKQKQQNKNQDSDTMDIFNRKNQLEVEIETDNYFQYTMTPQSDVPRIALGLPIPIPILVLTYSSSSSSSRSRAGGTGSARRRTIGVYPTLQFLYSHHVQADYITQEVKDCVARELAELKTRGGVDPTNICANFLAAIARRPAVDETNGASLAQEELDIRVQVNQVRQSPQYTLAALQEGIYVIGMKDQFNVHDLAGHPLHGRIQYVADDMGFVLYDAAGAKHVDEFGPYYVEQYILMEILSKHEVAHNMLNYYVKHRQKLQASLESYDESQGQGFICWRFLMNEAVRAVAAETAAKISAATAAAAAAAAPVTATALSQTPTAGADVDSARKLLRSSRPELRPNRGIPGPATEQRALERCLGPIATQPRHAETSGCGCSMTGEAYDALSELLSLARHSIGLADQVENGVPAAQQETGAVQASDSRSCGG